MSVTFLCSKILFLIGFDCVEIRKICYQTAGSILWAVIFLQYFLKFLKHQRNQKASKHQKKKKFLYLVICQFYLALFFL